MNSRLDKIIWESAFDKKKRNPGLTFNAELALARRSNNPSTYLPTPSRLLPSPCPPLGPPSDRCTDSRFPYPFQGLFPPSPHPSPPRWKPRYFPFFLFVFPSTSYPSALYLSTCPPLHTPLPSCPSNYVPTPYLPIYLSSYPSPTYSPLPALLSARLRTVVPTPASHTLPEGFFPPSPRPKPSQMKAVLFSFFSFFMLIRRDSNPSPLCLPLCLPISCLFNAYANCAIPARLQIQWFFCMLFICKSNSCPSLAVENNDIMNLWPRGPRGFRGPSTKTNQSLPNIMETVAFSALRKPLFNGFLYLSERSYS